MFHCFLRRNTNLYTWDNLEKYPAFLPELCQAFRLQLPDEKEATMILALLKYDKITHKPFPNCEHLIWPSREEPNGVPIDRLTPYELDIYLGIFGYKINPEIHVPHLMRVSDLHEQLVISSNVSFPNKYLITYLEHEIHKLRNRLPNFVAMCKIGHFKSIIGYLRRLPYEIQSGKDLQVFPGVGEKLASTIDSMISERNAINEATTASSLSDTSFSTISGHP